MGLFDFLKSKETTIARDFKVEFDNLIKEVIAPILKENGFKKKASNFYKPSHDLIQVVNVQKSKWNSKDNISFTFNIGFFSPVIFLEIWDRPIPDVPKNYDCFMHLRPGLITHKRDKWYELNKKVKYDQLAIEIKSYLQDSVINLLNRYQTLISLKGLFNDYPSVQITMPTIQKIAFMMKTHSKKEVTDFLFSEYKNAQIPKWSISVINYPDWTSIETESEPKINQEYIDSLIKIAKKYNIEIQ